MENRHGASQHRTLDRALPIDQRSSASPRDRTSPIHLPAQRFPAMLGPCWISSSNREHSEFIDAFCPPSLPWRLQTAKASTIRRKRSDTLRLFFGEHRIPPFDLWNEMESGSNVPGWEEWCDRTMQRLDAWERLYYSEPPFDDVSCFITPPREDMGSWYIEVGHLHDDDEHTDLLTLPPVWLSSAELFFRPMYQKHHTDQTMRNTFFAPLLERIHASRLDLNRIDMSVGFADESGVHNVELPVFLQTLGLLSP